MRSRLKRDRYAMKWARYNKRNDKLIGFRDNEWSQGRARAHSWLFHRKVHASWDDIRMAWQVRRVWEMFYNN